MGEDRLLVIQTDRLRVRRDPATPIRKGRVLTELSFFWFRKLGHVIQNHLTGVAPDPVVAGRTEGRWRGARWW